MLEIYVFRILMLECDYTYQNWDKFVEKDLLWYQQWCISTNKIVETCSEYIGPDIASIIEEYL